MQANEDTLVGGTVDFVVIFIPVVVLTVIGGLLVATFVQRRREARRIKEHFLKKHRRDT